MFTKYIKHIAPVAALLLSLGLGSCVGDLDVTSIDPKSQGEPDASGLFNKCYANMALAGNGGANGDCDISGLDGGTSGFVRQLYNAQVLTTDEAICCWSDEGISAFNYNEWDASHPMLKGLYARLYFGISLCNHYLEVEGDYDPTMTAEIRFLRAYYYYVLMDLWGNVPFTTTVSADNPEQISRADLFTWIENELLDCKDAMSEPQARTSTTEGYGRADRSAAWMLLARLYLNAEIYTGTARWEDAATYAELVIDSPHKLFTTGNENYSAYQMLFMGNNGENGSSIEALLPLLQDGVKTTSWGTTLFMIAGTYKAAQETPGRGTTETWAGNRARRDLVDKFFPNGDAPTDADAAQMAAAAGDDRALLYSKDRNLTVDDVGEFTDGYTVAKFTNVYSDGGTPHNSKFVDTDYFLMRSAEAYLTYAEATARLNNGQTTSVGAGYVNQLRERAHASTQSSYSLRQLCDEWSREFYHECIRRTVLVRYGYFGGSNGYSWEWKGGLQAGRNFDSHLNIFAIPEDDLNTNSNLTQNPGY